MAADASAWGVDKTLGLQALRDLRAARRRRYAENVDLLEVLYRLYLEGSFSVAGDWR